MGGHNLKDIFLGSQVASDIPAGRRCRCFRAKRRQGAFLNSGIHIRFVIVADIKNIVVAVNRSGKRLKADVRRCAIAGEAHGVKVSDSLRPESGFHPGQHGSGSCKCRNNGVVSETQLRKVKAYCRHAAGWKHGDRAFSQNF